MSRWLAWYQLLTVRLNYRPQISWIWKWFPLFHLLIWRRSSSRQPTDLGYCWWCFKRMVMSIKSTLAKGPGPYGGCRTTCCCCNWINSALIPFVCRLSVVGLCHHLFKIPMKGWNTLSGFPLFPETSHKYLHNSNVSRLCACTAGKRWMDIFAYICKSLKCIKIEEKQHIPEEILSVNFIIFPVTCISVFTEALGSRRPHGSRD